MLSELLLEFHCVSVFLSVANTNKNTPLPVNAPAIEDSVYVSPSGLKTDYTRCLNCGSLILKVWPRQSTNLDCGSLCSLNIPQAFESGDPVVVPGIWKMIIVPVLVQMDGVRKPLIVDPVCGFHHFFSINPYFLRFSRRVLRLTPKMSAACEIL